ncbi:SDR family NAD(P)-dependent oxidoreductase, partial [Mesorhizobium sp. M8A.F.Ca.ET.059.01.1.1]
MPAENRNRMPLRALVTGAAGGLGREVAVQLARRGCFVAVTDINGDGLAETARQIGETGTEAES